MRILCAKYTTTLPNIIKIFNNRKFSSIFTHPSPPFPHSPPFHFITKTIQNAQFPLHRPPPRTHFPLIPLFIYQIITFTPHPSSPRPPALIPHPFSPSRDLSPSSRSPLPHPGLDPGSPTLDLVPSSLRWRRCRRRLAPYVQAGGSVFANRHFCRILQFAAQVNVPQNPWESPFRCAARQFGLGPQHNVPPMRVECRSRCAANFGLRRISIIGNVFPGGG